MWYQLHPLAPQFYRVQEPGHVSFYLIQVKDQAILLDSGLGIAVNDFKEILARLGIKNFVVLCTHLHCDHAGLHFLADQVYVGQSEFQKYHKLNDHQQILHYYELLQEIKSWPLEKITETRSFEEKVKFIQEPKLQIHGHDFEVLPTPGHTTGHLCFISHSLQSIFLGDLVYDGMLYLHLPDSDLDEYIHSLEKLLGLIEKNNYTLLPCHNSIPLPSSYVRKVYEVCLKIKKCELKPTVTVKENAIFSAGDEYHCEGVKIQIKRPVNDWP